jgi:hypothetical protein
MRVYLYTLRRSDPNIRRQYYNRCIAYLEEVNTLSLADSHANMFCLSLSNIQLQVAYIIYHSQ